VGGTPDHVTLTGVGTQTGLNPGKVKLVMLVYADSVIVDNTQTN
jgi:hypothetical protein